jgi:hypothetical protein
MRMKKRLIAVSIAAFAIWLLMPAKRAAVEMLVGTSTEKTAEPVEEAPSPPPRLPASAPAARAERKGAVPKRQEKPIRRIDIGKLMLEEGVTVNAKKKSDPFSKALVARDRENMDLDLGGKLPWPYPDSPLMPKSRELGFHVGLDYHMNENLDLAGVAGVSVPSGADAYSLKPNVEQIGVRARYRF